MLYGIFQGISYFITIIEYAMWIYCICSWILSPFNKVMRFLARIIDPVLRPIRNVQFRLFPRLPLDLSPLIVSLLLGVVNRLLWQLYYILR